jgi:hypothetical protein
MATVVHLPIAPVRDWLYWETGIRQVLGDENAPGEMVEEITRRMKEVHRQYSDFKLPVELSLPLPDETSQDGREAIEAAVTGVVGEVASRLHDFCHRVILDRLVLEIRLYGFRHPDSRACVDALTRTTT